MHAGRLSILMLLLWGWLWLSPGPPVLAQAIKVPTVSPKIPELSTANSVPSARPRSGS